MWELGDIEYFSPQLYSNGLWNPWKCSKGYHVVCGKCGGARKEEISCVRDEAIVKCYFCGALNKFSHSEFARQYDARNQ